MRSVLRLLRPAIRALAARPGFSAVVVCTLGLGIGFNTAVYTVLDAALIRGLPYADPGRLVRVDQTQLDMHGRSFTFSWPGLQELRAERDTFSFVEGYTHRTLSIRAGDRTELVPTALVSAGFLDLLGVRPALGRGFQPGEEGRGGPALAILTQGYWRERFGADPSVVGRTLSINGQPFTVVGVLGPGFRWPGTDLTPMPGYGTPQILTTLVPEEDLATRRNAIWIVALARLRPGVSMEAARARTDALAARLRTDFPVDQREVGMQVVPLREAQVGSLRPVLLLLWGAVALLLFLTCANVANLLLARAVSREQEMAVRAALGASRGALVKGLLAESLVLGLAGSALGWLLARAAVPALAAAIPDSQRAALPFLQDLRLDSAALLYSALLAALTGVLFGLVPALRSSRADLSRPLRETGVHGGTPGRHRAMQVLVLIQVALAVMLLDGAGVFARSLARVLDVDPGFRPEGVVVGTLAFPDRSMSEAEASRTMDQVLASANGVPGVRATAATNLLPGTTDAGRMGVRASGSSDPTTFATTRTVTPSYFETLGLRLLRGRLLGPDDTAESPLVAVVNETFARLHFPGLDPIGQGFQLTYKPDGEVFTVVGLVRDERLGPLDSAPPEAFYFPFTQNTEVRRNLGLALRTDRGLAIVPELRAALARVDGELVLQSLQEMPRMLEDSPAVFGRRYPVWLLGLFAGCATLLAAVGLFGVLSYVVGERTHELGLRMALGARRREVMLEVARRALWPVLGGAMLGLGGAALLGHVVRGMLVGAQVFDLAVSAAVLATIIAVCLLALLLPARRAASVDPATALRAQ